MSNKVNRRELFRAGVCAFAAGAVVRTHGAPCTDSTIAASMASTMTSRRIIHFPKNRSVGWVEWSTRLGGGADVEACADVAVPIGVPTRLLMMDNDEEGFSRLRGLHPSDLQELYAWFIEGIVDLDDVAHLSGLRKLEVCDSVVAGGRRVASGLQGLRSLALIDTRLDRPCLEFVSHCVQLRRLELSSSTVSNGDFAVLRGPKTLKWISLASSNVTDDGMIDPARFPALEEVRLTCTSISEAYLERLRHRFPRVRIAVNLGHCPE